MDHVTCFNLHSSSTFALLLITSILTQNVWMVTGLSGHGSYVYNIDSRFEDLRGDDPYLVEFYAPWCGHCKKLEPVYERVGAKLDGTGIFVTKVDATVYRDIASKYEVAGFPTILYIQGKKVVSYQGDRTAEDISRFAIRCRSPSIETLHSVGGLKDRLRQTPDAFFVYVGDTSHRLHAEYDLAAKKYSINVDFYQASADAFNKELEQDDKLPQVLVYKDGEKYRFDPMADSNLDLWVSEEMYTALQPGKGFALSNMFKLDKTLILLVAQETSADRQTRSDSKRALDGARRSAMDRNLRQFQFVVMETASTVSGIIMDVVPVPTAIAFHPITQLYYLLDKPVQEMSQDDWTDFLTSITTNRRQALGGQGFLFKMQRALYGLRSSLLELWNESRLIFGVVVVIPMFVVSLVVYMICCATWADEETGEDLSDSEEESSGQSAEASGHLKAD